ncbi:MAG: hypothetical protein A2Z72_00455 [Omnitrophica bacterium RBG_13_46_9]|nr:MAG: hypothetical protein A2Z72_00455 [Omnitrophica bacterium RBG_13_46_9]
MIRAFIRRKGECIMKELKTRSIEAIEEKMGNVDESSLRHLVLQSAKSFKTSWIGLGQSLYAVWKDKAYREWGFNTFDSYTMKEIGIRKDTALKLLRSYHFLEKEGPSYLVENRSEKVNPSSVPTYESVNALRLASNNKNIDRSDYAAIKDKVFQRGKDAREIKKDLTQLIKQREELEPEEAWKKKKLAVVRRFMSALKSLSRELKITKVLPSRFIEETDRLIAKLEGEVSRISEKTMND